MEKLHSSRKGTTNLNSEMSPYLRMHCNDPIDWHPWSDNALNRARQENKLIFLSIGYSTCHWCHVMGRESFNDLEVAEILNKDFIPILVDCEERPDINKIYMKACRLFLSGNGGWPLNVILTPEQAPVFAAVYLEKKSRYGRVGLMDVLLEMHRNWKQNSFQLEEKGRNLVKRLVEKNGACGEQVDGRTFEAAFRQFRDEYDDVNGGFGSDPRFIRPHGLIFLMHQAWRKERLGLLEMVEKTLAAVMRGGITDHVNGGVHRYSTDMYWRIPHFEKMIYDQAGLLSAYIEAYRLTTKEMYAAAAGRIIGYVLREMTDTDGLFFAGEDSDANGEEGGYFVWRRHEVLEILGRKEGTLFCDIFNLSDKGNFRKNAQGHGTNVLYMQKPLDEWAKQLDMESVQLANLLAGAFYKLRQVRASQIKPQKDAQKITAWNAYMISALAHAGNVLGDEMLMAQARKAADNIYAAMNIYGRLPHCLAVESNRAAKNIYAADYAFMARAMLDLYEKCFAEQYLTGAIRLAKDLIKHFGDTAEGAFFETAHDSEQLIASVKDIEERELPSANSVAMELFSRLHVITGEAYWQDQGRAILKVFSPQVEETAVDYPWFLDAAAWLIEPVRKVMITGFDNDQAAKNFVDVIVKTFSPYTVFKYSRAANAGQTQTPSANGKVAAYICENFACLPPFTSPENFQAALQRKF